MDKILKTLILSMIFLTTTSFTNPFNSHGSVKNGYYSPPSQKYQCLYPLGQAMNSSKWYYCEKISENKRDGFSKGEKTSFLYNDSWKISGFWEIGLLCYLKKKCFLSDDYIEGVVSSTAKWRLSNQEKLKYKKQIQTNGFPAVQFYYEGVSAENEPAGMICTVVRYNDAFAIINLIFSLEENEPSNQFVNKYNEVLDSFRRL